MLSRRAPLFIALPALLGLLHPAALAEPTGGAPPDAGSAPAAAAGALEATLDELAARVRMLDRGTEVAEAEIEALRRDLAAAQERIAALEAARAEDAATIAGLRAELAGSRAEAERLREEAEASRRGLERLNALLATATNGLDAAEGGRQADARETAAGVGRVPSAPATARGPTAGGEGEEADAAQVGEAAAYYAAIQPVNLRAGPRNGAEVLTVVAAGGVVRGLGRDGGWLRVGYTDPFARDFTGWVHGDFLRRADAPPRAEAPSSADDG